MLSFLSTKYWIDAAREEIIEWEKECAACKGKKSGANHGATAIESSEVTTQSLYMNCSRLWQPIFD